MLMWTFLYVKNELDWQLVESKDTKIHFLGHTNSKAEEIGFL